MTEGYRPGRELSTDPESSVQETRRLIGHLPRLYFDSFKNEAHRSQNSEEMLRIEMFERVALRFPVVRVRPHGPRRVKSIDACIE